MAHNIKLDSFKVGDKVAVQVIKKVDVDQSLEVIKIINRQIEEALMEVETIKHYPATDY